MILYMFVILCPSEIFSSLLFPSYPSHPKVRRALCKELSQYREISGISSERTRTTVPCWHWTLVLGNKLQPRATGIVLLDQKIDGCLTEWYTIVTDKILRQFFRHICVVNLNGARHRLAVGRLAHRAHLRLQRGHDRKGRTVDGALNFRVVQMQVRRHHQYRLDSQLARSGNGQNLLVAFAAAVVAANTVIFQPAPQFGGNGDLLFIAQGDGLSGDQQTALEAIATIVLPLLAARLPDFQRLVETSSFQLLFQTGVVGRLVELLP